MLNKTLPYIDVWMKFDTNKNLPNYTFNNPNFKLVLFQDGDEHDWAKIETSVAEFSNVNEALTYYQKNYLPHREMLKQRCYFIENSNGEKVATGTAWFDLKGEMTKPKVDWISVMPEYQGHGLGKAIVYAVVNKLLELYPDQPLYLHTQTWSHPAIALYQNIGFEIMDEINIWENVKNPEIEFAKEIISLANTKGLTTTQAQHAFEFNPCTLEGEFSLPPSKSYLHRYIIAAALSNDTVILENVTSLADDILVTLDVIEQLGYNYTFNEDEKSLKLVPTLSIYQQAPTFYMKESGTSLRLLLPLLIHKFTEVNFDGENKLPTRPLDIYLNIFNDVVFTKSTNLNLPLHANGHILPGDYTLPGDVSSQFISGLLYVLPLLNEASTITLSTLPASLPYIKMTLVVLKDFDIIIEHNDDYTLFKINGNQVFKSQAVYVIESDYSAQAFLEVAKAIGQTNLELSTSKNQSLQGDAQILSIIKNNIKEVDLTPIPDLAPILAVYFSQTGGGILQNVSRLIHKESNRLLAIEYFLTQAGIGYKHINNNLIINSGKIKANKYFTFYDHRITMSLIIASTIADGPMILNEISSINKSFPQFIKEYKRLGGKMNEQ